MNIFQSISCIYNNIVSNFYIVLNIVFPFYTEEILQFQYKNIEMMNETIVFKNNSRKRKRFNIFVENLIQKNKEFIEKIRQQEREDDDINNYEETVVDVNYDKYETQSLSDDDSISDDAPELTHSSSAESNSDTHSDENEEITTEEETIYEKKEK